MLGPPGGVPRYSSHPVRVLILANPKSGMGRGLETSQQLASDLRGRGLSVNVLQVGRQADELMHSGVLRPASALIVMGGDGTLHHAADLAVATGTPVFHYPMGNENLFAREFSMRRDHDQLEAAIRAQRTVRMDLGVANGKRFMLMAGVGIDASIIHRVARVRKKAIGHRSYVLPGISEVLRPCLPHLTIEVDGKTIVENVRGAAVIGNSRRYGVDLDPCRKAQIDDGLLDVCFYPAKGVFTMAAWMLDSRRGRHLHRRRLRYAQGSVIRVTSPEPAPVQLDGEAPGIGPDRDDGLPESRTPLEVTIEPAAMSVLLPPGVERPTRSEPALTAAG